jgi:DNA-binding NarL/FixJ family response regulator
MVRDPAGTRTRRRILIADDHDMVRKGLRVVLESAGYEVCGEAATGIDAVALAAKLVPDVCILDVSMPGLNGLDAARQITAARSGAEVLVLTVHDSERMIRDVLAAGARGYLLKSDLADDLLTAVASLLEHKPYFTSKVAQVVLSGFLDRSGPRPGAADGPAGELTPRQREIVQLIAEGLGTKAIAARLRISVKTVETHRARLSDKLGLKTRADLVRLALDAGLLA